MAISIISETAHMFFSLLGVQIDSLDVEVQDADRDIYLLKVKTPDSALLIGPHGRTLEELQGLIVQILESKLEHRIWIHLEVNDYLEEKDRRLFSIVERKIADVMRTGGEDTFPDLSAYDRKKVHAYVSDKQVPGLLTYSQTSEDGKRILHIKYDGDIDIQQSIDLDAVEI